MSSKPLEQAPLAPEFMQQVAQRTEAALASGALAPLRTEQSGLKDGALDFIIRQASSLAAKSTPLPGGPRDPNFNPFLHPEEALVVADIGAQHVAILNKFPVCLHHLVLARREFAEQCSALELSDFTVLALLQQAAGGTGFFNGGAPAGASQRHKHVQWLPEDPENASLRQLGAQMPPAAPVNTPLEHPALALRHCMLRLPQAAAGSAPGAALAASAQAMLAAYRAGAQYLGLQADSNGLYAPYNMLCSHGWLFMVLREREHFEGVSLNALSFGGVIYVQNTAQAQAVRAAGPLAALRAVSAL